MRGVLLQSLLLFGLFPLVVEHMRDYLSDTSPFAFSKAIWRPKAYGVGMH